ATRTTEFVERKGIGHPDTICDGIAEAVSRRLSRHYREAFGQILHHNTDKVQLVAGSTNPAFGGGEIVEPIYVLLGGRATRSFRGEEIPVDDLAIEAATDYVDEHFRELAGDEVEFESRIGETSTNLQSLFDAAGVPKSNDTSIGVGYAPLSETERIVSELEPAIRDRHPAVGEDVKVMAWRRGDELRLTVATAIISRDVGDVEEYVAVVDEVRRFTQQFVTDRTDRTAHVDVNAADDIDRGRVYLTETGLSAEMGDDGNVGRGNRVNGVITPHRPMSLEATGGKNPVSHVGKLYNVVARRAAERIHRELDAAHVEVKMLSQIGAPITEPEAVDVDSTAQDRDAMKRIVTEELEEYESLTDSIVAGEVSLF
ncbi:MAG: methionine adenosyltransferase, partial [Halanaeroarchaeum sp.]